MLTRLGHGAVVGSDDEDGTVHLGGACDHVLDVVGVAGAVDVSVVPLIGLILNVRDGDSDTAVALFGRLVNAEEVTELGLLLQRHNLCHGGCQCGLTVVDVTDGSDVEVRLSSYEFLLSHPGAFLLLNRLAPSYQLLADQTMIARRYDTGYRRIPHGCLRLYVVFQALEPTTGLEPVTPFLPRTCSTN